jgi:hypothetical protein
MTDMPDVQIFRIFASAILVCGALAAQGPGRPGRTDPQMPAANAENYLKSLKEARCEQIRMRLDVPEERANAIAAKWADLEAPMRRIHVEAMSLWRQIQFIVQEASPEKEKSRKVKPLYDQYMELRKELSAARQRLYHELPAMGDTPIQQARMLFLMEEMERKERNGLKARRLKRRQDG